MQIEAAEPFLHFSLQGFAIGTPALNLASIALFVRVKHVWIQNNDLDRGLAILRRECLSR
jgi:hypothetical protein